MNGSPAKTWSVRNDILDFASGPVFMGIVNTTPDSFSDGGSLARSREGEFSVDRDAALDRALRLEREGAGILDIGGQSTRPGSERIAPEEEIRRTVPLIQILAKKSSLPISIDTYSAKVAEEACRAGASIINDISAGTFDPDIIEVARKYSCGIVLSHIKGTPKTMQSAPVYENAVAEIMDFLRERKECCLRAGIKPEMIALDPGIGFGKSIEHNLAILENIGQFHQLGSPILVGHSRKSFLVHYLPEADKDLIACKNISDELTARITYDLFEQKVQIIRVHNVQINRRMICR
ncbi:MAG: dihydropteroate synthase [Planctomycetia bacterium]|nr:dihydropteroate synthase [Planctomycetia bacterium]